MLKKLNGNRTTHIWDGANIIAELGNDNAVKYVYVRGIGLIKRRLVGPTPITTAAVNVIAPVVNQSPNRTATGVGNFTISPVTWSTIWAFRPNTRYTATVTLTANQGVTFNGLRTATINGNAAAVTNNTGRTVTLSYQFPPTETLPYIAVYIDGNCYNSGQVGDIHLGVEYKFEWEVRPDPSIVTGDAIIDICGSGASGSVSEGWLVFHDFIHPVDATINITVPTINGNIIGVFGLHLTCGRRATGLVADGADEEMFGEFEAFASDIQPTSAPMQGRSQWYLFNARGDVIALVDLFGNVISEIGMMLSLCHLLVSQPTLYRIFDE